MSKASGEDLLDHALRLVDVLSFCLCEDMPKKWNEGSEKLYFLVNSIEELIKKSMEEYKKEQYEED